jgi:hypothetical protein
MAKPSIGRIVHYVSTATGQPVCRAAIVTEVHDTRERVSVQVFLPDCVFPDPNVAHSETSRDGGTWHWPEREED